MACYRLNIYSCLFQFQDESSRLKLDNGKIAVIDKFYQHPSANCHYVFADTVNKAIFTSMDCGESFASRKLEMTPSDLMFDKAHDLTFLIHDLIHPEKKLYVTKTFGETFSHVGDYVKTFDLENTPVGEASGLRDSPFAVGGQVTTLFLQRMEPDTNRTTILSSQNYFERKGDVNVQFRGALEFEYREKFLFVTTEGDKAEEKILHLSQNSGRFVRAHFGNNLPHLDFNIIDVTEEGQVRDPGSERNV